MPNIYTISLALTSYSYWIFYKSTTEFLFVRKQFLESKMNIDILKTTFKYKLVLSIEFGVLVGRVVLIGLVFLVTYFWSLISTFLKSPMRIFTVEQFVIVCTGLWSQGLLSHRRMWASPQDDYLISFENQVKPTWNKQKKTGQYF